MGQSALGFALCKLQTADVLQTSFVLAQLLVDDQLHTPADDRRSQLSYVSETSGTPVSPVAEGVD